MTPVVIGCNLLRMQPKKLRSIRMKAGLKQWQFGKKLKLSQGAISFYETGRTPIPRDMPARLRAVGLLPKKARA